MQHARTHSAHYSRVWSKPGPTRYTCQPTLTLTLTLTLYQAEADQIAFGMAAKNVPVEYVLYPDEGHGFARPVSKVRKAV